jgi:hypothetical protein
VFREGFAPRVVNGFPSATQGPAPQFRPLGCWGVLDRPSTSSGGEPAIDFRTATAARLAGLKDAEVLALAARDGRTPLLLLARESCVACVDVLAKVGADLNIVDPERHTALIVALINGHFDVGGPPDRSRRRPRHAGRCPPDSALGGRRRAHDAGLEPPTTHGDG